MTNSTTNNDELEARYKREDELQAKYPEVWTEARMQVAYARQEHKEAYPKDKYVQPILEALDRVVEAKCIEARLEQCESLLIGSLDYDDFIRRVSEQIKTLTAQQERLKT